MDASSPSRETAAPPESIETAEPRDYRGVVVVLAAIVAVAVIVVVAVLSPPGSIPADVKNTRGESTVAIAGAAFTALGTIVSSYLGIKTANHAREDAVKANTQANRLHAETLAALGARADRRPS